MSLDYRIDVPANPLGRATFRFALYDTSHCPRQCMTDRNLEVYLTWNRILEQPSLTAGQLTWPLEGSGDTSSSFYRPGWVGAKGNNLLDPQLIKGYAMEITLNREGLFGSYVSGVLDLSGLRAEVVQDDDGQDNISEELPACVMEPNYMYSVVFANRTIPFATLNDCCAACQADEMCNYAYWEDLKCFIAESLPQGALSLDSSSLGSQKAFFYKNHEVCGE